MVKPEAGTVWLLLPIIALNALIASLVPHSVFALTAFVLFCLLIAASYRAAPFFVICFTPILFFWMTELFSGVFIEAGASMVETRTQGEATGAFSRLSLLYSLITLGAGSLWMVYGEGLKAQLDHAVRTARGFPGEVPVMVAVAALLVVFIGFGLVQGFPLLLGADRFAYRMAAGSQALVSFLNNRFMLFVVLGLLVAFGRRPRLAGCLFVVLMAVSVLYGEKFTSLIGGSLFFAMPILMRRLTSAGRLPWGPISMAFLGLVVLVVPVVLLNYGVMDDPQAAFKKLEDRSALQGQLWFLADRECGRILAFDSTSVSSVAKSLIFTSEQTPFSPSRFHHGMYYVMRPFTDSVTMYWAAYAGGGFVFAHMPYWLMAAGYLGALLIGTITALFSSWAVRQIAVAVATRDVIALLLWTKITTWVLAGYTLGNLYFFFGVKTFVLIAAAFAWNIWGPRLLGSVRADSLVSPGRRAKARHSHAVNRP